VFLRVIGEAYIPIAFRMAQAADPKTKLYYNDYNLEYGGAKANGAIRITKLVQSYGLRIDGVGLQAHMTSESTPTQNTPTPSRAKLAAVLKSFTDLNVDVAYTELDIRMNTPANAQKLKANADAYARMIGSCMDVKRCVGITVWVSSQVKPSYLTLLTRHRESPISILGSKERSRVKVRLYSGMTTLTRSHPTLLP
jgi:endo-1,4-beta-xylanase